MEPIYYRDAVTIPSSDTNYLEKTIGDEVSRIIKILEDEYGCQYNEATFREIFLLIQDFSKRVTEILTSENTFQDQGDVLTKNLDQSKYLGGL